jgi:drug/metabolite transporter (DMT)-like permease
MVDMTARQTTGLKWAIIATLISGFAVFINALVVKGIDPLVHTTIKNSVAGLLALLVLLPTAHRQLSAMSGKQWSQLLAIAVIGGSLPFILFFTGLKEIGAVQGALLQKTLVLWVVILAVPILKEKVTGKMLLGVGLLYASSLVYGLGSITAFNRGHVLVLLATILWAVENILAKTALKELPVNIVVGARMFLGTLMLWGLLLITNKGGLVGQLSQTQWAMLFGVGVLLFGYVMTWYRALKYLPVMVVAGVLVGSVVITTMLEALLIKHAYTPVNIGQALLIIVGVGLVISSGQKLWLRKPNLKINTSRI